MGLRFYFLKNGLLIANQLNVHMTSCPTNWLSKAKASQIGFWFYLSFIHVFDLYVLNTVLVLNIVLSDRETVLKI